MDINFHLKDMENKTLSLGQKKHPDLSLFNLIKVKIAKKRYRLPFSSNLKITNSFSYIPKITNKKTTLKKIAN